METPSQPETRGSEAILAAQGAPPRLGSGSTGSRALVAVLAVAVRLAVV